MLKIVILSVVFKNSIQCLKNYLSKTKMFCTSAGVIRYVEDVKSQQGGTSVIRPPAPWTTLERARSRMQAAGVPKTLPAVRIPASDFSPTFKSHDGGRPRKPCTKKSYISRRTGVLSIDAQPEFVAFYRA